MQTKLDLGRKCIDRRTSGFPYRFFSNCKPPFEPSRRSTSLPPVMATLTVSRKISAPRKLLWDYLSTPAGLSCWQADSVEGSLDSGNFSLRWPQLGARLDLSVSEVDVGHRLLLRAGQNVLELRALEGTVSLTHQGLQPEDDLVGFESSWKAALCLLELAVTRHPRIPRQVEWLFQPAPGTAALAHCFFTDADALGSWLGTTSHHLQENAEYSLKLFGGETLSGKVLFDERDVCLHVRELGHGALILRTLPGPQGRRILAIGVSTWGEQKATPYLPVLEGALHRLSRLLKKGENAASAKPEVASIL